MEASLGDGAFNRGTNSFYIRAKDILDTRGARMFHRGDNAHGFLSARTLEHSVHLALPPLVLSSGRQSADYFARLGITASSTKIVSTLLLEGGV